MKKCRKCLKLKDFVDFQKAIRRKDGLGDYCRPCKSIMDKEYRDRNKERINLQRRQKYAEDPSLIKIRNKESYNRHRAKRIAYVNEWLLANKDKVYNYRHKRKALMLSGLGYVPHDYYEIIVSIFGSKCLRCNSTNKIEIDHVTPLSNGGLHCISNMQPLCKSCNSAKSNKSSADYRPFKYYYEE